VQVSVEPAPGTLEERDGGRLPHGRGTGDAVASPFSMSCVAASLVMARAAVLLIFKG